MTNNFSYEVSMESLQALELSALRALGFPGFIAYTLTYQNLLFCRVPINSILGFIIGTYKKVGFGSLR